MGGYRWGQNKNAAEVVIQRGDFYWIGGTYQATPAVGLTLEFDYHNVKSLFGNTSVPNPLWQIALVANYAFSQTYQCVPDDGLCEECGPDDGIAGGGLCQ